MTPTELGPAQQATRPVESVQRAIALLSLFADAHGDSSVSVSAAARHLGVSRSTASRLMGTLAAGGLIEPDDESRRYRIGAMTFVLGNRFWGTALAQTLRPIVRELSRKAGSTAQIGMLQDQYVLYLLVVQGAGSLRVVASAGDKVFAHASALGKALLAGLSPEERRSILDALIGPDGKLPGQGPRTIRDVRALADELILINSRGYSTSDEESTTGIAALGAAVHNVSGPALAVSIAFPAGQHQEAGDRAEIVQHVHIAAQAIREKFAPRREVVN